MSGFLLDTSAVSEMPKWNPGYIAWLKVVDPLTTFISVLTIGEVRRAIENLPNDARRASLDDFVRNGLTKVFSGRVLSFDTETAQHWGRIVANAEKRKISVNTIDSMIAATALQYNLSVVTRNAGHFEALGVSIVSPWTTLRQAQGDN